MCYFQRFAQCGILAAMLTVFSNVAAAIPISSFQFQGSLNVASGSGSGLATITFNPNFTIRAQNGVGSGDLVDLTGSISGDYQFNDPAGADTVVLSSLITPNFFTINDGVSTFSAQIDLFQLQGDSGGAIFGTIDFSSSSYGGTNPALVELNALIQNTPNVTVTFQTIGGSGVDLDDLFLNGSGGIIVYSARARVTPVPEPTPLALLGLGLLCGAGYVARKRSAVRS